MYDKMSGGAPFFLSSSCFVLLESIPRFHSVRSTLHGSSSKSSCPIFILSLKNLVYLHFLDPREHSRATFIWGDRVLMEREGEKFKSDNALAWCRHQ